MSKRRKIRARLSKISQEDKVATFAQTMRKIFEPKILEIAFEIKFIKR